MAKRWRKRSTEDLNALLMDVPILLTKEEYVEGMEQRSNSAAVLDVQILLSEEECV